MTRKAFWRRWKRKPLGCCHLWIPRALARLSSHFRQAKKRTIMMMMLKVAPQSTVDLLRKAVSWSHLDTVYDTGKCCTCWWKRRRNELSKEREIAAPVAKINAEEEQSEHPECGVAATRPQQGDAHPNCPSSGRQSQSPESTPGTAGPQEGMFSLCCGQERRNLKSVRKSRVVQTLGTL